MDRVLLIAPHILRDWDYRKHYDMAAPPMGLLSIGTVLKENGFDVDIVDASLWEDYRERIKAALKMKPLFAGISAMTSQVPSGIEITEYIRRISPGLPVVWGGIHPTLFPEQTCKDNLVDAVVVDEGEHPCLELAQAIQQGGPFSRVRGIGYKENGNIKFTGPREPNDINKLPFPRFEILDIEEYMKRDYGGTAGFLGKREKTFMLHTGTGCPYRCAFCINSSSYRSSRKHRQKSVDRILDEIGHIVDRYKVEHVVFRDDNFFINQKWLSEFLDGLERRGLRITWYGTVRADFFKDGSLSDEMLGRMARLGCVRVSIGVESGSERILELLKKDIRLEHVERAAHLCRKHGIVIAYSFMMGIPGEEREDTVKTLRFIDKLMRYNPRDYILGPQIFRPYPGSSLYEECVRRGFAPPETLRGWGFLGDSDREGYVGLGGLPWLEERELKFLQYVNFACRRGVLRPYSQINKMLWWFKFLFSLRLRSQFWRVPFEIKVARFLSRLKRLGQNGKSDKISKETKKKMELNYEQYPDQMLSKVLKKLYEDRNYFNADFLGKGPNYFRLRKKEMDIMTHFFNLTKKSTILDVGCGIGFQAALLSPFADRILALDKNLSGSWGGETGLKNAQKLLTLLGSKNVELVTGVAENLPFGDGTVDVIVSSYMLEHTPFRIQALQSMHRVLKEDGLLIVSLPNFIERVYRGIQFNVQVCLRTFHRITRKFKSVGETDSSNRDFSQKTTYSERIKRYSSSFPLGPPHGFYRTSIEELVNHLPNRWLDLFKKAGFIDIATFATRYHYHVIDILSENVNVDLYWKTAKFIKIIGDKFPFKYLGFNFCIVAKKGKATGGTDGRRYLPAGIP